MRVPFGCSINALSQTVISKSKQMKYKNKEHRNNVLDEIMDQIDESGIRQVNIKVQPAKPNWDRANQRCKL